jgi:hypothetical protein
MAALTPTDTFYLGQLSALTDGSERPTKSPLNGGTLHSIRVAYTLTDAEATNDTLNLCYLPKGALVHRNLSYIELIDPGTGTLTVDVGTSSNGDCYADGIALSAGGSISFGSTVLVTGGDLASSVLTTTDNTLVILTCASASGELAGTIYVTITYSIYN